MTREVKERPGCGLRWPLGLLLLTPVSWVLPTASAAAVILFLQNGRTIQAERMEILGDRIRIEKPTKTIELPRSAVLSIHPASPPTPSPTGPPAADVYRGLTQQMTDRVRREIQNRPPPCTGAGSQKGPRIEGQVATGRSEWT
jgi:hypothetical protein